jgi:hypothetical protein
MRKRTIKIAFEAEFTGELPADVDKPEEWAKEFQDHPEKYTQHREDMEGFKASIELDGRKFSISLTFKIIWTDDEDYLDDGSVIQDQIDIWEDELPSDGLTISVMGNTLFPGKVQLLDYE